MTSIRTASLVALACMALSACSATGGASTGTSLVQPETKTGGRSESSLHSGPRQTGQASWYATGRKTASGERFDPNEMTAAHRTLPFNTKVRVENTRTGDSVVVRINDRGPFVKNRIVDLSRGAASRIGMIGSGVAPVAVTVVEKAPGKGAAQRGPRIDVAANRD